MHKSILISFIILLLITFNLNCQDNNNNYIINNDGTVTVDSTFIANYYQKIKECNRIDSLKTLEIIKLKQKINNLDLIVSNLERKAVLDSLIQQNLNDKIELIRPKWYEKPVFNIVIGAAIIYSSSMIVKNVK